MQANTLLIHLRMFPNMLSHRSFSILKWHWTQAAAENQLLLHWNHEQQHFPWKPVKLSFDYLGRSEETLKSQTSQYLTPRASVSG